MKAKGDFKNVITEYFRFQNTSLKFKVKLEETLETVPAQYSLNHIYLNSKTFANIVSCPYADVLHRKTQQLFFVEYLWWMLQRI